MNAAKYLYIYFDYDPGDLGYDKEIVDGRPWFHPTTVTNDPMRADFNHHDNKLGYLYAEYDEPAKTHRIRKIFQNISGSTKTVKRIYLLSNMTSMTMAYSTSLTLAPIIIACEEVNVEVLDGEEIEIEFTLSFPNQMIANLVRMITMMLTPRYQAPFTTLSYYDQNGVEQTIDLVSALGGSIATTIGSNGSPHMRIGTGTTPVTYEDGDIETRIDNALVPNINWGFRPVPHYNETEEEYEAHFVAFFHNQDTVPHIIKEISYHNLGRYTNDTTGYINSFYNAYCYHRHVLETPANESDPETWVEGEWIYLEPDEMVEIRLVFKVDVSHGS